MEAAAIVDGEKQDEPDVGQIDTEQPNQEKAKLSSESAETAKREARIAGHCHAEMSNYVKFLVVDKEDMKAVVESVQRLAWLHMDFGRRAMLSLTGC